MSDAEQLGQRLRAAREAKDLSIDETERATRIRAKFLEALEAGDYSSMTPVQAQGFMRNYTRFLGLDYELLIAELDDDNKGPFRRRRRGHMPLPTNTIARPSQQSSASGASGARAARQRPVRRSRGLFSSLLIVIVAGAIVVGLIFGITTFLNQWAESETQPSPTVEVTPSIPAEQPGDMTSEDSGLMTGEETLTAPGEQMTPAQAETTAEYIPPMLTGTSVNVVIEVVQRTFVRIEADGEVLYEDFANEGEILNYTGQTSVSVRANNAAGLNLTVNNLPQGIIGERGELFDQTFTLNGAAPPEGGQSALPDGDATSGLPSGDTVPSGASEAPTAALPASPTEATLFFTPTPFTPSATIPLDPGDGSVFDSVTTTPEGDLEPSVTPTPTPTPTVAAPSATVAATTQLPVTSTPTPKVTPTPTLTVTVAADTATAEATALPSATPSATPTRTPTASGTPSNTPTATPSITPSVTPSPTATTTNTSSPTPTWTPSPTWSATPSITPTATPFLPPRLTRTPSPVPKQ